MINLTNQSKTKNKLSLEDTLSIAKEIIDFGYNWNNKNIIRDISDYLNRPYKVIYDFLAKYGCELFYPAPFDQKSIEWDEYKWSKAKCFDVYTSDEEPELIDIRAEQFDHDLEKLFRLDLMMGRAFVAKKEGHTEGILRIPYSKKREQAMINLGFLYVKDPDFVINYITAVYNQNNNDAA